MQRGAAARCSRGAACAVQPAQQRHWRAAGAAPVGECCQQRRLWSRFRSRHWQQQRCDSRHGRSPATQHAGFYDSEDNKLSLPQPNRLLRFLQLSGSADHEPHGPLDTAPCQHNSSPRNGPMSVSCVSAVRVRLRTAVSAAHAAKCMPQKHEATYQDSALCIVPIHCKMAYRRTRKPSMNPCTSTQRKIRYYRDKFAENPNIFLLPAITNTYPRAYMTGFFVSSCCWLAARLRRISPPLEC